MLGHTERRGHIGRTQGRERHKGEDTQTHEDTDKAGRTGAHRRGHIREDTHRHTRTQGQGRTDGDTHDRGHMTEDTCLSRYQRGHSLIVPLSLEQNFSATFFFFFCAAARQRTRGRGIVWYC